MWRVALLAQQRHDLRSFSPSLDPAVRLALALLWATAFLALTVFLWRGWRWARWSAPAAVTLYTLYQVALTTFFVPAAAARQGWLAGLLLGLVASLWLTWTLNRASVRDYWQTSGRERARTSSSTGIP